MTKLDLIAAKVVCGICIMMIVGANNGFGVTFCTFILLIIPYIIGEAYRIAEENKYE